MIINISDVLFADEVILQSDKLKDTCSEDDQDLDDGDGNESLIYCFGVDELLVAGDVSSCLHCFVVFYCSFDMISGFVCTFEILLFE